MIPNASVALDAHLNAVGAFFRSTGPEACRTGLLHRLFVGFRRLMVHSIPTHLQFKRLSNALLIKSIIIL